MSLYFILMLATLAGPVVLSFDKKVHFYTHWKILFPAIFAVAILYIIWDELFTQMGVWGFNPDYLQGWYLGHLPLEEICFFLFVPYACFFVSACLKAYFPNFKLKRLSAIFALMMTTTSLILVIVYWGNWYTTSASFLAVILTVWLYYRVKVKWYADFVLAFIVVQIPFFIVNGALTGMFTDSPVVWYNELEIMGPRWGTIPLEDTIYNYGFLLLIFYFYHVLHNRKPIKA